MRTTGIPVHAITLIAALGSAALLSACYAGKNSGVGVGITPQIREEYVVRGVVRAADLAGKPIAGAIVTARSRETVIGEAATDNEGGFALPVGVSPKHPFPPGGAGSPIVIAPGGPGMSVVGDRSPLVVEHGVAAIQTHEHWSVALAISADGFEPRTISVEVPAPIGAEPMAIDLTPIPR